METSTIDSLIACIGLVLPGILALLAQILATRSRSSMQLKTLNFVLAPLLRALIIPPLNFDVIDYQIREILRDSIAYVPPKLQEKMLHFLNRTDDSSQVAYSELLTATESFFNWYRKFLHFPFDRQKLLNDFAPDRPLKNALIFIFWSLYFIGVLIGVLYFISIMLIDFKFSYIGSLIAFISLTFAIYFTGLCFE